MSTKRQCTDRVTFHVPSDSRTMLPRGETATQEHMETHTAPSAASKAPANVIGTPMRRRGTPNFSRIPSGSDFESMYRTVANPGPHEFPTGTAEILRMAGYDDLGNYKNPSQNSLPGHNQGNPQGFNHEDDASAAYSYGQPGVGAPHPDLQTYHSHIETQYSRSPHPLGSQQAVPSISYDMPRTNGLIEPPGNGPASLESGSQAVLHPGYFLGVSQPNPSSAGPSGPPTPGSYATGSSARHSPAPWEPDFSIFDSDSYS